MTINRACGDVLRIVFSFTNSSDVHKMPLVCKRWHMLMKTLKVVPDWSELLVSDVRLWSKCFPLAKTLAFRIDTDVRPPLPTLDTWRSIMRITHLTCDFVPKRAIQAGYMCNLVYLALRPCDSDDMDGNRELQAAMPNLIELDEISDPHAPLYVPYMVP
jgi:hypothetical protein